MSKVLERRLDGEATAARGLCRPRVVATRSAGVPGATLPDRPDLVTLAGA